MGHTSLVQTNRPIIALTVGDPAGIGPEIVLKALQDAELYERVRPLVFADQTVLESVKKATPETGPICPCAVASNSGVSLLRSQTSTLFRLAVPAARR